MTHPPLLAALSIGLGLFGCASDNGAGARLTPDSGPTQCTTLEAHCPSSDGGPCERLFGRPNASTGLADDTCGPGCQCNESIWTPLPVSGPEVERLREMTQTNPFDELDSDPYLEAASTPPDQEVCGVILDSESPLNYRLETFTDQAALTDAGARLTHYGACGLCSTLQDLAVYIAYPDLTEPVRACGLTGFGGGPDAQLACILDLGFTEPCAQIWSYNTSHTGTVCRETCLALLGAPYHEPGGQPNACILCDEELSGPVFKAVAGRTRRNSGLPTALCRPCSQVRMVDHRYP